MISFNLKSSLVIALICFVLGFCVAFMLTSSCNDAGSKGYIKTEVFQKKADSIESAYKTRIALLENKNAKLSKELDSVKSKLVSVKEKTKNKAEVIRKMIVPNGYPAKELLKKVDAGSITVNNDLSNCDSLVQEIASYLAETELKDSLYEAQNSLQDSIISNKDAVIDAQTFQYNELSMVFRQSLEQQSKLLKDNRSLQKKIRRQKFKTKLFTIGGAVLSGIATHYLSK